MFPECPALSDFDRRQKYLGEYLTKSGYQVILAQNTFHSDLKISSFIETEEKRLVLLPVPASSSLLEAIKPKVTTNHVILGGHLPEDFTNFCKEKNIEYIDYMKFPTLAIENAVATAEGAISQAICTSDINLHQSRVLIIGFGKCGEVLADKLSGLKCQIFISTRDSQAQARAMTYGYKLLSDTTYNQLDIIFNTAPALVITRKVIDQLNPNTIIIDIASKPGGTDFNYCIQKGIIAKHCPGLPGKYSPKTSAEIIFHHISSILKDYV